MTSAEVPNVDNIREIMNDVDEFNDNFNLSDSSWSNTRGNDDGLI